MTDDTRQRLEAAVRASWGYDDLAVYADHLQAIGDPRGEVMALDLVAPRDRNAPHAAAWRDRRLGAIAAWVGHALVEEVAPIVDLGFIKELKDPQVERVLASPAGDVVRAYDGLEIAALAARSRPWLERLRVHGGTAGSDDLAQLLAGTPHLVMLDIDPRTFGPFPHPAVRYLKLTLTGEGDVPPVEMPAVAHLDLQRVAGGPVPTLDGLPVLRSLDLARCSDPAGQAEVFVALASQRACRQIEHVTLPALGDDRSILDGANRLLDAMPALRTARLARTYGSARVGDSLGGRTPPVELLVPFPWPPPAAYQPYNTLVFQIPEEPFNDIVALPPLIAFLEQHYERFSPDAQAAWTAIFEHVRPNDAQWTDDGDWIAPEVRPAITLAIVARAVDACDALPARSWVDFRTHFRDARRGLLDAAVIGVSMYR